MKISELRNIIKEEINKINELDVKDLSDDDIETIINILLKAKKASLWDKVGISRLINKLQLMA